MKQLERELRIILEDFPQPFSSRQLLEIINGRLRNGSTVNAVSHRLRAMGYTRIKSKHSRRAGVWIKEEA